MHGDGVRVHGKVQEGTGGRARYNGARACTGRCRGPAQRAITVHGRVHGCTGRCRKGTGQSAITVHGDGARVQGKVQGTGAERDNGARGRCTGEGDRGRAR